MTLVNSSFTPLSTEASPFRAVDHSFPPTSFVSRNLTSKSLPTNTWWQNAILVRGNNPIFPYPYSIILNSVTAPYGASISLPNKEANNQYVATFFYPGMIFGSASTLGAHRLIEFSELSATFQFPSASNNGGSMTMPIVRGSPYITAIYQSIVPAITTIHAILSVNGMTRPGTINNVNKLKIQLNNGQIFLIYSNRNATWEWNINGLSTSTSANSNWVLRMAVLTSMGSTARPTSTENEEILDRYSAKYATHGSVVRTVNTTANQAVVEFQWTTQGTGDLLLMALPHHAERLVVPQRNIPLQYDCIKGTMTAVVGQTWKATFPLLPISFSAPRSVTPWIQAQLRKSLLADMNSINIPSNLDSYNFGKLASKLGRLILIADELNEVTLASSKREQLANALEPWLNSTTNNALRYDRTWGGVITNNGWRDSGADYGHGIYNDHHYHFGYFVYAIAALLKCPCYHSFYNQYQSAILSIVRDYANPSSADSKFPVLRHVDAFDGHSWASGLTEFADGRNQESSSESINAYYALGLLGKAINNKQLENLGQILTSVETYSVNKYWHMTSTNSVYPAVYAANKCVGIVWQSKVVDATWFASGSIYVHGINFLPVTPITEHYFPIDWIREEYPHLLATYQSSRPAVTDEWRSLMYSALAVIDPIQAYTQVMALNAFDNGNTRTNMLYWIGTRPTLSNYAIGFEDKPSPLSIHSDWSAGCTKHIGMAIIRPSQYIDLNDPNDVGSNRLPLIGTTDAITFETWFMVDEFNGVWPRIFDLGEQQSRSNIILSFHGNLRTLAYSVYNSDGQSTMVATSNTIPLSTWIHVVVVMQRTTNIGNNRYNSLTKLYVNGVENASGTTFYPQAVERRSSYLGRSNWSTDGKFIGKIDYLSMYPFALSAAQVQTIYAASR